MSLLDRPTSTTINMASNNYRLYELFDAPTESGPIRGIRAKGECACGAEVEGEVWVHQLAGDCTAVAVLICIPYLEVMLIVSVGCIRFELVKSI